MLFFEERRVRGCVATEDATELLLFLKITVFVSVSQRCFCVWWELL
jgi:hypothetical protein